MTALFQIDLFVMVLLVAALLAGVGLTAWFGVRRRGWLIALQPLVAVLLLAALSLRDAPAPDNLIVLTPGAELRRVDADARGIRVGLPGAPISEGVEAVPDLATALRRHAADRLLVVGDGLQRHDREAVGERALQFQPSPPPTQATIVELHSPATVRAGAWWSVTGRVHGARDATLVLLDPAGKTTAEATPDAAGRFVLETMARARGQASYELQLRRGETVLQSLPVAVVANSAAPLRVLLLAASPSPELKYLRRWALDAGLQLDARIALAPGLAQHRGAASLDAAQLAELDLLVVDERSWSQLAPARTALRDAVAGGLGLMLRVTGPVPERVADELKTWGIDVATTGKPIALRLPTSPQVALHAWRAESTRPALLVASNGTALAHWSALGRGRVGTWRLTDSHRLYTRGDRERHATLWSNAFSTLARPRGAAIQLPNRALIGERAVLCGVPPGAEIATPNGAQVALAVVDDCAAFWPREAGWHRLETEDAAHPFHVFDPRQLDALLVDERRTATQALVTSAAAITQVEPFDADLWRAILLAAWLLAMAGVWWLERRSSRSH